MASSQPAVLLGRIAAITAHIRLGSGAVQTGFLTPLAVLEQFGMLDAFVPGRFDLGLGRSAQRLVSAPGSPPPEPDPGEPQVVDGLLIPRPFSFAKILRSARSALHAKLLTQPGAAPADLDTVVGDIEALVAGSYADDEGNRAHAVPGEGARLQL